MAPGAASGASQPFDDLPCQDVVPLTLGPTTLRRAELLGIALHGRGIAFHTDLPFDRHRGSFRILSWRMMAMGRHRWKMPVSIYICRQDLPVAREIALQYVDPEMVAKVR